MKLFHISDLHLGIRIKDFSLIEDQQHILEEILNAINTEKPDAVAIAGDIYDKSNPSAEAVRVFDSFIVKLAKLNIPCFIVSGNHDSPERLSFASRLIDASGIHIAHVYDGIITPFTLEDELGKVNIYMLPFVKPANVRAIFPDEEIATYTDAIRVCIKNMNVNPLERNVLITHQLVAGDVSKIYFSDSEDCSLVIGTLNNVSPTIFDAFDYVCLGHIHKPQNVGGENMIRYSGTPLKYSFSESSDVKSVTIAEINAKGSTSLSFIPLKPLRDMRVLKGTYDELMAKPFYDGTTLQEDYIKVVLTDEEDIPEGLNRLRTVYHNIMDLTYDNTRTAKNQIIDVTTADVETKSPLELFDDLFFKQNNSHVSDEQREYLEKLIEKIWEEK